MKKLYQGKGRRVHPAPPPAPDAALALLPAALLALAATLTAEEQEVLAYLLSGIGTGGSGPAGGRRSSSSKRQGGPHQPEMGCGCFGCYKSYWARWDASPNRHLIHRIIEAVEEGTAGGAPTGGTGATRRGGPHQHTSASSSFFHRSTRAILRRLHFLFLGSTGFARRGDPPGARAGIRFSDGGIEKFVVL